MEFLIVIFGCMPGMQFVIIVSGATRPLVSMFPVNVIVTWCLTGDRYNGVKTKIDG